MSVLTAHVAWTIDRGQRRWASITRTRLQTSRHSTPDEADLCLVSRKATLARRNEGMREVAEVDVHGFQRVH